MARPRRRQRTNEPEEEDEVQQQQEVAEEDVGVAGEGGRTILPGMYLDIEELSSIEGTTVIVDNLVYLSWLRFARFRCSWYSEIVEQFYAGAVLRLDDYNPSIGFDINGTQGRISANDIAQFFDMPINYYDIDLPALDYPARRWPLNWPLVYEDCVAELNNGRPQPTALTRLAASRLNLTGSQRLALKLVIECFLPVNNKDSILTHLQTFVCSAIMHRERINLPSLIIKHMHHQKDKPYLPYGMILSHMLREKGVDVSQYQEMEVPTFARIGKMSLKNQEIYAWENKLWSKWEVFEYFENDRGAIWRANSCTEPPAPRGWVPCGNNRAPLVLGDCSGAQSSHQAPPAPTRRLTDRELLESIAGDVQYLRSEQDQLRSEHRAFTSRYDDYQWRQNAYLQEIGDRLNMREVYDSLFAGYPTGPPPPAPAPTDHDDHEDLND